MTAFIGASEKLGVIPIHGWLAEPRFSFPLDGGQQLELVLFTLLNLMGLEKKILKEEFLNLH